MARLLPWMMRAVLPPVRFARRRSSPLRFRPRRRREETYAHHLLPEAWAFPVPVGRILPMKTTRERAEEKRQAKLEQVREQVQSGELVIRKFTEEERLRYPPRPPRPKRFPRP